MGRVEKGMSVDPTRPIRDESSPTDDSWSPVVSRGGKAVPPASTSDGTSTSFGERLNRARDGDRSALGRLLLGYRAWLRRQARRGWPQRLDAKQDPSDLAQDVLQEAGKNFGQFQGQDQKSFRKWLRRILKNVRDQSLRHWNRLRRRNDREQPIPGSSAGGSMLHDAQTPALDRIDQGELIEGLDRALTYLEDGDQQLLRLRYIDGLEFKQIAVRLGQSPAALRQRAHRLRERLRRGIPVLNWANQEGWRPIQCQAIGAWCLRTLKPARIAREMHIPEAAVMAWIRALPAHLRDSLDSESVP